MPSEASQGMAKLGSILGLEDALPAWKEPSHKANLPLWFPARLLLNARSERELSDRERNGDVPHHALTPRANATCNACAPHATRNAQRMRATRGGAGVRARGPDFSIYSLLHGEFFGNMALLRAN